MTVAELIAALQEHPGSLPVYFEPPYPACGEYPVRGVRLEFATQPLFPGDKTLPERIAINEVGK